MTTVRELPGADEMYRAIETRDTART